MTRQIAVRLPDDLVEFIDGLVTSGQSSSRAAVITRAVERERRLQVAARDVAILSGAEPDPDFDALAEHVVHMPLDDLD
jgi:Arc/MetJ-type ribon-helix-helix transcriptional regulator